MNRNDQNFIIEKIRTQYTEKTHTELDELKALDKKVKRPANVFAYTFGTLGAIVMGSGMSLVMTDIGSTLGISHSLPAGIIIGVVGLAISVLNYPLYVKMLGARRREYADEIIRLSDKIMKG